MKPKILIVEDDENTQIYLSELLEKIECDFIIAETGLKAIDLFHKNIDLDLILMDIKLPDLSGFNVTREIRKTNNKIIIIAQTAYALSADRDKALKCGCTDYMSKPILPNTFYELMDKYLNNYCNNPIMS